MNKVLDFFKGLNQLAQLVLVGVLVFTITYSFGSCQQNTTIEEYNKQYKKYQDSVSVVLNTRDSVAKVMEARADSLRQDSIKAVRQTREINRLKGNLSSTQAEKDRLQREIDSLSQIQPDTHPASLKKDTLIAELRKDSTNMATLIVKLEQRDTTRLQTIARIESQRDDALGRAERAERQLEKLPDAPENPDKWFFQLFNKPTRTQVGVVATTVGIIIGLVVGR